MTERRSSLAGGSSPSSRLCRGRGGILLSLALYLCAFGVLYYRGALPAPPLMLGVGSSSAGFKAVLHLEAKAWDITLVLPTTESGGREAQLVYSASLANTRLQANLIVVNGGVAPAAAAPTLGGRVRRVASAACPDASEIPGVSVAWHAASHFSCKALEGLCAAFEGGSQPAYVAIVAQDALFRWAQFLRAEAPGLRLASPRGLIFAKPVLEWNFGLPEEYAASKPTWPAMPVWNSTVVFSGDLASKLCRMHRGGLLQTYGPPEMLLGMILSTVEGLTWASNAEVVEVQQGSGGGLCPQGLTLTRMSREAWAACLSKAQLEGDAF